MRQGPRPGARVPLVQTGDRRSLVYLTAVLFLVYLSTGLWSPLLSVYVKSLGAQTRDIGVVLATYQASSLISQFWWGSLSDRLLRRKPLLLCGTAGLALAFTLIGAAQHWTWLLGIRVIEGIALAAYSTGSLALIGDLLEDQQRRGRVMGLYRMFGSLAFSLAALSGGWLADNVSIRLPLLLAAACFAAAFGLGTRIRERPARPQQPPTGAEPTPERPERDRGALLPFLAVVFTWAFAMGAVVQLWPVYMQSIGYSKTAVGSLWALAALGEVPCFVLAGYLADRWGRAPVLLAGLAAMSAVFYGYTVARSLVLMIPVQMFRSFAYASFEAPALLLATELGLRRQRGRLASFYYAAAGAGGILGPVIGGAVAQQVGLAAMYRRVILFMLFMALAAGGLLWRRRRLDAPSDHDPARATAQDRLA